MKLRGTTLLLVFLLAACSITPQDKEAATRNDAPYLVLISIDGFRHDYLDRFPSPALQRIANNGIRAKSMRPVWPTLTFPNHYSIATGLYPREHGIIANKFMNEERDAWYYYKERETVQDGRWYHGEPIWVAAERAGIGSAAFYFVGTEAAVDGIAPSDWRPFDASVPGDERIDQALDWLALPENERPHLVTLYFEHVDTASHFFGAATPECVAAIYQVDKWIGKLLNSLEQSPIAGKVTVAVVSDHGQSGYKDVEPFIVSDFLSLDGIELVENGPVTQVFIAGRDVQRANAVRDAINAHWRHGRAWLPDDAPPAWHIADNPSMADVVLQADPGYAVLSHRDELNSLNKGDHGWSPEFADMHGIFMARGPGLPAGKTIGTINAVDIYPLLLQQLGLPDRRSEKHASPHLQKLQAQPQGLD